MKVIFSLLFIFHFIFAGASAWSVENLEQPRKYDATNFVSNPDGILSSATVRNINELLNDINRRTGAQVSVVVIEDYDASNIDDFATELFTEWGVGEEGANNGVLLIVATGAREWVFRTGRGIGSVLTDVETGRIARNEMIPSFRTGNYEEGIMRGVSAMHRLITTPEAIEEIREGSERAKEENEQTVWDILIFYGWLCFGLTLLLALIAIVKVKATAKVERHQRYVKLYPLQRVLFGLSFVGLGLPFLVYLPYREFLHLLRDGEHLCPNCNTKMHKLDEITDNQRLTPAQDAEERFNSVDYDVWECPNCGEEDIYPYINTDSDLTECAECHARTSRFLRDRVVQLPTTRLEGLGVKEYTCLNCGKLTRKPYKIPRKDNGPTGMPFIYGGGHRGGGSGFGGFSGGSFGGGLTGGGGSSGRW